MPQIGWFEILVIVVIAIIFIGPKDFPFMVKKIGKWIGSAKRYFSDFQKEITDIESSVDNEISIENKTCLDPALRFSGLLTASSFSVLPSG